MTRFVILLLLPAAAVADTITISVLSQTTEAMAVAGFSNGPNCSDIEPISAQCNFTYQTPFGNVLHAISLATVGPSGELSVEAGTDNLSAAASASVTETLLITGESGTGYMVVWPALGYFNIAAVYAQLSVAGNVVTIPPEPPFFDIFSFPFNAVFTFSYSVYASADAQTNGGSGQFAPGATLFFSTLPTNCSSFGTCPGDTPLAVNGTLVPPINTAVVPEPSSFSIILVAMTLMPFTLAINPTRRWLRHILPT